jgi:SnoaL-like domain
VSLAPAPHHVVTSPEQHGTTARLPTGADLLGRFVQDVLNAHRVDAIPELFSPNFRDNHPLFIPGLVESPGTTGTLADLRDVVSLLASPVLDMSFSLEDVITADDRVAYRLFGQGTVGLVPKAENTAYAGLWGPPSESRHIDVADSRLSIRSSGWSEGKILGDQAVVMYSCVGIFKLSGTRFVERWGPEVVE